jgi:hypothetical protein
MNGRRCATKGHPRLTDSSIYELNSSDYSLDSKRILLQRFQREHGGFDFSSAEVTGGNIPDANSFMGGLDRDKVLNSYK